MPFYIFSIGDGGGCINDIDFFQCESEFLRFKKRSSKSGDKIYFYKKGGSLAEIVSHLCDFKYDRINPQYEYLCDRFGKDALALAFPTEHFNDDLVEKIKKLIDEDTQDAIDAYCSLGGEYDGGIDWDKAGEEELRRWDKEDGGSWRVERDVG